MKIFHKANGYSAAILSGAFFILLLASPLSKAHYHVRTLNLGGGATAEIVAHSNGSGVMVDVSIQGPGGCDYNVSLSSYNKRSHSLRQELCYAGGVVNDVHIDGTVSIDNYRISQGSKIFDVRIRGSVTDVARNFFTGRLERVIRLGVTDKTADFNLP